MKALYLFITVLITCSTGYAKTKVYTMTGKLPVGMFQQGIELHNNNTYHQYQYGNSCTGQTFRTHGIYTINKDTLILFRRHWISKGCTEKSLSGKHTHTQRWLLRNDSVIDLSHVVPNNTTCLAEAEPTTFHCSQRTRYICLQGTDPSITPMVKDGRTSTLYTWP